MMRRTVVVGAVWGIFCALANGNPVASTLAQMAVPWVWVAAFVGYRMAKSTKTAALLGGISLLVANVGYFTIGTVSGGLTGAPLGGGIRFFALWTAIGLVVGPIAGVIGWWITAERTALPAVVALATASVAEPLALWAHIDHIDAHLAYVIVAIVGLTVPVMWFRRTWRKAVKAAALVLALTYPTAVTLELVLIGLRQISPPMRLL
jgi:hypothetical protein